jgi:hypothetical protein
MNAYTSGPPQQGVNFLIGFVVTVGVFVGVNVLVAVNVGV